VLVGDFVKARSNPSNHTVLIALLAKGRPSGASAARGGCRMSLLGRRLGKRGPSLLVAFSSSSSSSFSCFSFSISRLCLLHCFMLCLLSCLFWCRLAWEVTQQVLLLLLLLLPLRLCRTGPLKVG